MKRKILLVLVILIFITYLISPLKVFAKTIQVKNYVAFGDSIPEGYGLEDTNNGYVALVSEELDCNCENLAVSGMNSTEFLELLKGNTYETKIKQADLITISIGSNDLLGRIQEVACDAFGLNKDEVVDIISDLKEAFSNASATGKLTMIKDFYTSLTTQETRDMFQQAINGYEQNWENIVKTLRTLNSNARIVVTEFYNPFYGVEIPLVSSGETINFSDYVETYISQMNEILNSNTTDYEIAKIHDKFDTQGLTNVNISLTDFNIDPHPNVAGHKVIADTILFEIIENDKNDNNNSDNINNNINSGNGINNNIDSHNNVINDNTVSQIKLPFTGDIFKNIILICIMVIICFAIGVKIRERYYNI